MYQVSNAFKTMMKKAQRVEHVRGTVGNISFTDRNVISLSYSNRCSDTSDVTLGYAYIGELQVQFVNMLIARGAWRGKVISLEYGLEIDPELHTVEWVPVGQFTITQAEWSDMGISVRASDVLSKLDTAFGASSTSGTIYDFLELVEELSFVPNGMTAEECASLPNGTESLGLYSQNDISTIRDFLGAVAQATGGFATADRTGGFVIRSYADSTVVDTLQARERISGSVFSDFSTSYSGISITDIESGATIYYTSGSGAVISIGSNPLLQYGVDTTKTRIRGAVATVAQSIAYTPFNISVLNCPVYDLGDLLELEGGVAGEDTVTACVMSIEWTFKNSMTLQGFGADPSLSKGKTKTDKALNGMKSKTSDKDVITHVYVNSIAHNIGENTEVSIAEILFATVKPKTVKTLTEVNLDLTITDTVNNKASCQVFYYLNGNLISYSPIETWDEDGKHILSLMYPLETLSGDSSYDFDVRIELTGGKATIAVGDIHCLLEGQGLVAVDEFNGTIKCTDEFEAIYLGQNVVSLIDTFDLSTEGQGETYYRLTEDGDLRIVEDGDFRITEEGQ